MEKVERPREVVVGGFYKHFKGERYIVLAKARSTETDEMMVVYKSLRDDLPELWCRVENQFFDSVVVNDTTVPRFKFLPIASYGENEES